jgi:hypothetical protein
LPCSTIRRPKLPGPKKVRAAIDLMVAGEGQRSGLLSFPSSKPLHSHRRRTLDFYKVYRLPSAFQVIQRNIEGLIHFAIKVADRPRVHDTLHNLSGIKTPEAM